MTMTGQGLDFRRLCQRISSNDPSLTHVGLVFGARADDDYALEFARAMTWNTVVESVELSYRHYNTGVGYRSLSLQAASAIAQVLSSKVSDVRLIGVGPSSSHDAATFAAGCGGHHDNDGTLNVFLSHLASSNKLRSLKLSHIQLTSSSALGFQKLLSLTSTLRSLDLLSCSIASVSSASTADGGGENSIGTASPIWNTRKRSVSSMLSSPEAPTVTAVMTKAFAWNWTLETISVDVLEGPQVLNAVIEGLLSTTETTAVMENVRPQPRLPLRAFHLKFSSRRPLLLSDDPCTKTRLYEFLGKIQTQEIRIIQGGLSVSMKPLIDAIALNSFVRKLHLESCQMTEGDILTLSTHLQGTTRGTSTTASKTTNWQLNEVVVHEVNLGLDGFEALVRALYVNTTVQVLDVCDINLEGRDAAIRIRDLLLNNRHLRVLKLGEVAFDDPQDSRLIAQGLSRNETLQELDLFYFQNLDLQEVASSFSRINTLSLPLCCFGIGPQMLSRVLTALQQQATLTELDFSNNRFGNHEAVSLSVFVRHSRSLRRLKLDQNEIGDSGAITLFTALADHSTMEEISLSGNRFGETAILALASTLPNVQLRRLSFWWKDDAMETTLHAMIDGLSINSSLLDLHIENSQGPIRLPCLEFYLYRNRFRPLLSDERRINHVPPALWPRALSLLSTKQPCALYFVMREKLPSWIKFEKNLNF